MIPIGVAAPDDATTTGAATDRDDDDDDDEEQQPQPQQQDQDEKSDQVQQELDESNKHKKTVSNNKNSKRRKAEVSETSKTKKKKKSDDDYDKNEAETIKLLKSTLLQANPYLLLTKKRDKLDYAKRQSNRRKSRTSTTNNNAEATAAASADSATASEVIKELQEWFEQVQTQVPYCLNYHKQQFNHSCTCHKSLNSQHVAKLLYFMSTQLEKGQRQVYYKQWLAASPKPKLRVVIGNVPCWESTLYVLCSSTFRNLFGLREEQYSKLTRELFQEGNTGPNSKGCCGNTNRRSGSAYERCKNYIVPWITQFAQQHGVLVPSTTTTTTAGTSSLETKPKKKSGSSKGKEKTLTTKTTTTVNVTQIPAHISRRSMYVQYVYESGYQRLRSSRQGAYGAVEHYLKRKDDPSDVDWPAHLEPTQPVCSFSCFQKIWERHCPLIVLLTKQQLEEVDQQQQHDRTIHQIRCAAAAQARQKQSLEEPPAPVAAAAPIIPDHHHHHNHQMSPYLHHHSTSTVPHAHPYGPPPQHERPEVPVQAQPTNLKRPRAVSTFATNPANVATHAATAASNYNYDTSSEEEEEGEEDSFEDDGDMYQY